MAAGGQADAAAPAVRCRTFCVAALCDHSAGAESASCLSFATGEIIEILRWSKRGWWWGKRQADGQEGWVSSYCVQPAATGVCAEPASSSTASTPSRQTPQHRGPEVNETSWAAFVQEVISEEHVDAAPPLPPGPPPAEELISEDLAPPLPPGPPPAEVADVGPPLPPGPPPKDVYVPLQRSQVVAAAIDVATAVAAAAAACGNTPSVRRGTKRPVMYEADSFSRGSKK
eukprot:gnl/TRDRNA2_/TRDRNA2_196242_c0_seq1.p1 gnl/TRDRNA2_/TRDRNA2_196242_c0~~gnl/TRDRNA2_/TRDRNA2_196242_c0_seq1.p1  ORF type:complete len:237 (-),score=47.68 gnl/TRDRNA2_/TRDRNA2_196242_c0_seq1:20-706(-)